MFIFAISFGLSCDEKTDVDARRYFYLYFSVFFSKILGCFMDIKGFFIQVVGFSLSLNVFSDSFCLFFFKIRFRRFYVSGCRRDGSSSVKAVDFSLSEFLVPWNQYLITLATSLIDLNFIL